MEPPQFLGHRVRFVPGTDHGERALSRTGEAFLTPTVHQGIPAIRAAFSNWRTTPSDVDRICRALGA